MPELVRLSRGLYRPEDQVGDLADRAAAFLDALPVRTVVGGITAARLHGLWLPGALDTEAIEFVQTRGEVAPRRLGGSRRREIRTRRRSLRPDEIVVLDGLPVTSPARTWIDLAETLSLEDLVAAGDSALRRPGSGADADADRGADADADRDADIATACYAELDAAVRAAFHRRGVLRARQALTLLDRRSRSRPESHLRLAVVLGGLPWPEVNEDIHTDIGEWLAQPDLHFKRARLALEYNGSDHADVKRMRSDITREIDVDQHGWKVVVFGPAEVFGRAYRIAPYVRHLLDTRDPGWARHRAS